MKTKALGIFLRTAIIAAPIVWACLGPAHAQGYEFEWIVTGGGPDRDVIEEIAVDSAGELFATGTYSRRMEIEGETVERPDADAPGAGLKNSLFVVKLDRSADVTWLLSPTRAGLSYGDDVKISSDGVVWIGAQYSDDIALGGRIIRADPPESSLIARLSTADGSVLGLERLPSSYNALAPAPDGGMYNYSLPTTASPADETARLRRLRRTGAEQWSADRIAPYQPYNIFADQDGNALLNVETSGVLARITGVDRTRRMRAGATTTPTFTPIRLLIRPLRNAAQSSEAAGR